MLLLLNQVEVLFVNQLGPKTAKKQAEWCATLEYYTLQLKKKGFLGCDIELNQCKAVVLPSKKWLSVSF